MIFKVSSLFGESTTTFWKRRSSAPSFSKLVLYSSKVVAPIHWISPRASAGLKMLEPSIEPDELPAPTNVWISSMKIMMSGFSLNSSIITFIRSSNCPRYFVPATIDVKSKRTIRLSFRLRGHSPLKIFMARPSTIAVLPQPGSPMMMGLFFFLRERICAIRLISISLPITGSNLPSDAILIRSFEKLSKTGVPPDLRFDFCVPSLLSIESIIVVFISVTNIQFLFQKPILTNCHIYLTLCHNN